MRIFLIILLGISLTIGNSQNQEQPSRYVPLRMNENVPYLDISSCSVQHYGEIFVMLDTGSSQFWLADSQCQKCMKTGPFCPHIKTITTKIQYYLGQIQGSDSFLNICDKQYKFMCVKIVNDRLATVSGHGILGLRIQSVGSNILRQIFKNKSKHLYKLPQLQYIFYYGINEHLLLFSHHQKYLAQIPIISKLNCHSDWSFEAQKILIKSEQFSSNIQMELKQYRLYVDTGASKIVFPHQLCQTMQQKFLQMTHNQCIIVEQGIACKYHIELNLQIGIDNIKLVIPASNLINIETNIIQIFCSPIIKQKSLQNGKVQKNRKIILGYPFIKSYPIGFMPNQSQINIYQQNSQQTKSDNLTIIFIIYFIMVLGGGIGLLVTIDYIRQKRSRKIII